MRYARRERREGLGTRLAPNSNQKRLLQVCCPMGTIIIIMICIAI